MPLFGFDVVDSSSAARIGFVRWRHLYSLRSRLPHTLCDGVITKVIYPKQCVTLRFCEVRKENGAEYLFMAFSFCAWRNTWECNPQLIAQFGFYVGVANVDDWWWIEEIAEFIVPKESDNVGRPIKYRSNLLILCVACRVLEMPNSLNLFLESLLSLGNVTQPQPSQVASITTHIVY